jgi:catechol 2,3-dioxygenase-like lactoylglutathione lyase family enzyme
LTAPAPAPEARRLLHCSYGCDDADAASRFLAEGLGLRVAMRSSGRYDGAVLGLDGEIEADASFLYDARGARTSPAVEVQGWIDPPAAGDPYASAEHAGIQAIGLSVLELAPALARVRAAGGSAPGAPALDELLGAEAALVRDPNGIRFDLVAGGAAPPGGAQWRHLRVTCRDLDASVAWYRGLGFALLERGEGRAAAGEPFGVEGRVVVRSGRLRLPDEPTELLLQQWLEPPTVGAPYSAANHRGLYRIALAVDDTRDAAARLEAAGVAIERAPRRIELPGTKVPDMWIAFLRDPDGVPVELVERPRGAFR